MAVMENYIPKLNDPVMAQGHNNRFVVAGIDARRRTADLTSVPAPGSLTYLLENVPWESISYLDASQATCTDCEREAAPPRGDSDRKGNTPPSPAIQGSDGGGAQGETARNAETNKTLDDYAKTVGS